MMRRVSRLGVPTLSGLALSLAACGEASDQAPDDAEPAAPEVATVEAPFNTSQTPATGTEQKGHELIIRKAIAILKARNLLPPKMSSENAQNRIIYGAYFADNPWAGNANTPLETVANVMSPNIPSGGLRWGVTSDGFNFDFPYGPLMPNLRIDAKADVQWLRGADNTQKASDALRLTITLTPTAHEFVDIDYSPKVYAFAQDNLYHYSYSELKDFNDPNITSDDYALRFYPFYDRHDFSA